MARWIVTLNKFSTSLTSSLHSVISVTPWWFLCQARRSFGLSQSSCVRCSFDAGLALFGTYRNHRIIGMTAWKVRFFNVHNGLTQTPCRVTHDSQILGPGMPLPDPSPPEDTTHTEEVPELWRTTWTSIFCLCYRNSASCSIWAQ